jgi:hypothetical protein
MEEKEIKIISVKPEDTLIFKFDMELGGNKLAEIADKFSTITGAGVICIDNKCTLETILTK